MFRELDRRESDGTTVTLEWDPNTEEVQLRLDDRSSPNRSFKCLVDPQDARLAFLDPFALSPAGERFVVAVGGSGSSRSSAAWSRCWASLRRRASRAS
jgi:hypothetical protein